jgi:hypothetical protein
MFSITSRLHRNRRLIVASSTTVLCVSMFVAVASTTPQKPEPKNGESQAANPAVQSEIEKRTAEKRAQLLKEAQSALEETHAAVNALNKGQSKAAIAALARVTGKLDLIVARDPKLAFAPISVTTTIRDLYSTADTVRIVVKEARDDLDKGAVQHARGLLLDLVSEADIQVTSIPLATYPAAIKAVAPLVDAGKTEEAKTVLYTALNTLVTEDFILSLPRIRARAMLTDAQTLAAKSNRKDDENKRLHNLIESARHELQLSEALGYGTKDSYKPLYAQLDDIQKKTGGGQSGKGFFDRIQESLKTFKFTA